MEVKISLRVRGTEEREQERFSPFIITLFYFILKRYFVEVFV